MGLFKIREIRDSKYTNEVNWGDWFAENEQHALDQLQEDVKHNPDNYSGEPNFDNLEIEKA